MVEHSQSVRRRAWVWLLVAPLIAGAAAVAYLLATPQASVLLITIDTLRPDRIGTYGYPAIQTPALDRLASEGMLFETAYCDMPWTTGSMSSVMTGQYSSSHGVDLPNLKLKSEAVTMAEILRDRGYRTGAIIGSFPLDSVYGLDQGFATYDDEFNLPMIKVADAVTEHVPSPAPDEPSTEKGAVLRKFKNDAYRSDEDVTDTAIRWLENVRGTDAIERWRGRVTDLFSRRRFFLWVHYFGPHEKLKGDTSLVSQEPDIVAAYDGDVEKVDHAVGRLLERLRLIGFLDQTLVIVHSDHGQNLGEFGVVGHGLRIDEATVRIPLIVRYPRLIPPQLRRVDVAHNIDILPTVLSAVGMDAADLVGRSLLPTPEDPRGEKVPAEQQIAYFSTKLTTMILPPLAIPEYGTVLGPVVRSGLRSFRWRFVSDQVVGGCSHGNEPTRGPFGAWTIADGKPLDKSVCESLRSTYLYPVTSLGDQEANVVNNHPDVAESLAEDLRAHEDQKAPLASEFDLSSEQEEKLRSLGYLK